MSDPMRYLWDEVEAYQVLGEQIYNNIVSAPVEAIRNVMEAFNADLNASYPIARDFMDRSIRNAGDVEFGASSEVASAIAASREIAYLIRDSAGMTVGTLLSFRSDPNLSRSFHDCTLRGALDVVGDTYTFRGELVDRYDFDYGWLPKTWNWRGVGLHMAGGAAEACTAVGLMDPYNIHVDLDFQGTK